MSITSTVRVVARLRPLLKTENPNDTIVETSSSTSSSTVEKLDTVKIPSAKNAGENYTFQFQSVFPETSTQQEIFDTEIASTIKPLFTAPRGHALTVFAYGSTGTGKTFTMRGGKDLKSRGVIPRLLSGIFRRARKMEKDNEGRVEAGVVMSYYEIYNDKVYDLLDMEIDKARGGSGLPVREVEGGRTVVVGLREENIGTLKEFEEWYDRGNGNRRTGATKLNASSSRSHAVLCVKITITDPDGSVRVSTASAIDLAGSEDNRRTGNGKEALVESASINKSLFVLAQCVEAISKKQARIPYRESKMTRILGLGQNGGVTVMILNLAPTKAYHLDTISSLNFANRTKKIEVREAENEIIFKGPPRAVPGAGSVTSSLGIQGTAMQRQPLRPLAERVNMNLHNVGATGNSKDGKKGSDKPAKAFAVYSDRARPRNSNSTSNSLSATTMAMGGRVADHGKKFSPLKRTSGGFGVQAARPSKMMRPAGTGYQSQLSKASIEEMVEKKVSEILASKALESKPDHPVKEISEEVQRRLDSIEQRLEGQNGSRAEGLSYLLMAKQHQARGEDSSALKMYQLALPYFPGNEKLQRKIEATKERLQIKKPEKSNPSTIAEVHTVPASHGYPYQSGKLVSKPLVAESKSAIRDHWARINDDDDEEYEESAGEYGANDDDYDSEESFQYRSKAKKPKIKKSLAKSRALAFPVDEDDLNLSPRTNHLLDIINTRNVDQIKLLKGVGVKRAEAIIAGLMELDDQQHHGEYEDHQMKVRSLGQLGSLKGVGAKSVMSMRLGIGV